MNNCNIDKKRLKHTLISLLIILCVGFLYLIFVRLTDLKIPCLIKLVIHHDCPGCGITRMCVAISKFKFIEAFNYNPFLFITLPYVLFIIIRSMYEYVYHKDTPKVIKITNFIYLICLIVWGIVRNMIH